LVALLAPEEAARWQSLLVEIAPRAYALSCRHRVSYRFKQIAIRHAAKNNAAVRMDKAFADILEEFVMLFAVVDPIGSIPVFLAIAASLSAEKHASIAIKAVVIAWSILMFFIVFGQVFLEAIGISLVSFQLAGSLVLLLFGLNMIFGEARPDSEIGLAIKSDV
jgi:hypothetical protein